MLLVPIVSVGTHTGHSGQDMQRQNAERFEGVPTLDRGNNMKQDYVVLIDETLTGHENKIYRQQSKTMSSM